MPRHSLRIAISDGATIRWRGRHDGDAADTTWRPAHRATTGRRRSTRRRCDRTKGMGPRRATNTASHNGRANERNEGATRRRSIVRSSSIRVTIAVSSSAAYECSSSAGVGRGDSLLHVAQSARRTVRRRVRTDTTSHAARRIGRHGVSTRVRLRRVRTYGAI